LLLLLLHAVTFSSHIQVHHRPVQTLPLWLALPGLNLWH
jgi:hypothetical protein